MEAQELSMHGDAGQAGKASSGKDPILEQMRKGEEGPGHGESRGKRVTRPTWGTLGG